jgi:hypothetical protein
LGGSGVALGVGVTLGVGVSVGGAGVALGASVAVATMGDGSGRQAETIPMKTTHKTAPYLIERLFILSLARKVKRCQLIRFIRVFCA